MTIERTPLHVFVAMPGKMGPNAIWQDVPAIKQQLYAQVKTTLEERLGRTVEIVFETDRKRSGDIYDPMYRAALEADVYIVDLTGANANVFLELGVRWSFSKGPTVLILQKSDEQQQDGEPRGDEKELPFNVQTARVVRYGPHYGDLIQAVEAIAEMVDEGLNQPGFCDSLVLTRLPDAVVPRHDHEAALAEAERLRVRIKELCAERAEELLRAADAERDPAVRIGHLKAAVQRAPGDVTASFKLGLALLEAGRNAEAAEALDHATRLDPRRPDLWQQLAIARSRGGALSDAVSALDEALALDPDDADTWATQGGTYRRLARATGAGLNWGLMEQARASYKRAGELQGRRYDSYVQLNIAQLDLLLSRGDPEVRQRAVELLRWVEELVLVEIKGEAAGGGQHDPWNPFKVLTVKALTGRHDEACQMVAESMERIPMAARHSYAQATIEPLEDCLNADVFDGKDGEGVQELVDALKAAASLSPPVGA